MTTGPPSATLPEHNHAHGAGRRSRTRLAWALGLVLAYAATEAVGGWLANSLALLADAAHMLSDAAALGLSLFALWAAGRPPSPRHSYGFYRAEVLAALVNAATLLAVSAYVLVEAYHRLREPPPVQGSIAFAIATGGLLVNLAGLALLHADRHGSLNLRGAWLHLLSDALGSVAAIAGGAAVWGFGWFWADPVASALIGLLVVRSGWRLLREAVSVLMECAPGHIDPDRVRQVMGAVPGVSAVHSLHIWSVTSGRHALSTHAVLTPGADPFEVLTAIRDRMHDEFGPTHLTIQVEPPGFQDNPGA